MSTGSTHTRAPSPVSGSRNARGAPHLLPTMQFGAIADRNSFPDSRDISPSIRSSSSTPHLPAQLNRTASRSSLRSHHNIDEERYTLYSLPVPHFLGGSRTPSPTASPAFTPAASTNSSEVNIRVVPPDSPIQVRFPTESCVNRRFSYSSWEPQERSYAATVQGPVAPEDGHLLRPASPSPPSIRVIGPETDVESGSSRSHSGRASPSSLISSLSQDDQEWYSTHGSSAEHFSESASSRPFPTSGQPSAAPSSASLELDGSLASANTSVADLQLMESAGDVITEPFTDISPVVPTSTNRYDRKVIIRDEHTKFTIPPLTIDINANRPPREWTLCQHPEGAQYFLRSETIWHDDGVHDRQIACVQRVFTDANLYKSKTRTYIEGAMRRILNLLNDIIRSGHGQFYDLDLVLDLCEDTSQACQYYFVNHKTRCVFWLDPVPQDMFPVVHEIPGIKSAYHVYNILQAQYWYHCELYPRSLQVTPEILDELQDNASDGLIDLITSKTSTVSLKAQDLDQLLKLLHCRSAASTGRRNFDGIARLVGRFMYLFTCDRVYNFHGVPGVRLERNESVYGKAHKQTLLIKLFNPLLFLGPKLHLNNLRDICTDGLIHARKWPEFMSRLNSEWQEFTMYATILLPANVGFLSIQSVDQDGVLRPDRSPAQIASYLSILFSIGSILISLILTRQNRDRVDATAHEAANFISERTSATFGLEPTAILYSLPYALLIWSMVSFIVAFSLNWFQDSDTMTKAFVGVLGGTITGLIFWCIFAAWDWEGYRWNWEWLRRRLGLRKATVDADSIHTVNDTVPSRKRGRKWLRSFLRPRPPDQDIELNSRV